MTRTRRSEGFTLVELLLVVVLFGLVITVIFTVVGALSTITASSSEQSNMARDLSYQLEILSKTIMQGKVIYANDDVVFLRQRVKVHVDTVTNNGVVTGRLVVRRWSTNAAGTAPSGGMDRTWIVSDLNGNLLTTPPTPLFTYFRSHRDTDLMVAADKSSVADTSLSAFVGSLPGGYSAGAIMRLRLTAVTRKSSGPGFQMDYRDVAVRPW
jgi:prepilin-type N-terminal cleavage/methylation domain-containing protein